MIIPLLAFWYTRFPAAEQPPSRGYVKIYNV